MKVLFALFFVVLTAEGIANATPINNQESTQPEMVETMIQVDTTTPIPTVTEIVETAPATIPEPEQTPKAKPAVIHPIGCENYRQLISQYEWNVDVALNVMRAESGCNPNAKGDNRVIGGIYAPSCGLFQIRTLQGRPTCEQLQDPATNIEWAFKLYRASGWKPWSVCNTGKVSCY